MAVVELLTIAACSVIVAKSSDVVVEKAAGVVAGVEAEQQK